MSIYTERFMDDDIEYHNPQPLVSNSKKAKKILKDSSKHYPNKNEAKLLRSIMAETGLNEDEVRSDRHYCELLSEAQDAGEKAKRTETERTFQRLIKHACQKTGLAPQHPDTIIALQKILDTQALSYFRRSFLEKNKLTAENVVKKYAKK